MAGPIDFSAANVDEPLIATASAAADNNMVMERNIIFSFFGWKKPIQSVNLLNRPGKNRLSLAHAVASTDINSVQLNSARHRRESALVAGACQQDLKSGVATQLSESPALAVSLQQMNQPRQK